MSPTPRQVLERLIAIVPGFADYWKSDDALFGDEAPTHCGVFSDWAIFVRDNYEHLSPVQLRLLGEFALECMAGPDTELCDAAATCFVENLTFERFSKGFEGYLAGAALEYYRRFQGE